MSIWRSFWGEQGGQERILLVKVIQLLTAQLVVQVTKQLVVVTKLLVVEVTKLLVEQLQPRKSSAGTARHLVANQLNSRSARVAGG